MEILADPATAALFITALAVGALIAGLLAGLLGVGGGIIIVPILYWILTALGTDPALIMHIAVGTSLLTIIPTAIASARSHNRRGNVDPELFRRWLPGVFIGATLGGLSARFYEGAVLQTVFGVVALLVAINMTLRKGLVIAEEPPRSIAANAAAGGVVGYISALMGIGGGTLSVPILAAFSVPMLKAVGTASTFGLVISIPAVLGFIWAGWGVPGLPPLSLGYVNLAAAAIIIPITVFTAPLGARIASSINQRALRLCFAVFLGLTAARMLIAL